ncbi:protein NLRC5-like [Acropora millepora]|uniref:protein NLRC5-like n=1 Tax=Acropora millepora TaxID=45264 RepID=UPI001CF58D7D|nr:protein NLRC5-like [Acropora millepora]
MDCTAIIERIWPKTLNKFRFALILCWIALGTILCGASVSMEINESRLDFRCGSIGDINQDFIRAKCYDQYRIQNHKLGIPPYLFVIMNVLLIPTVTVMYSLYAKSTVSKLESSLQDAQGEPRNRRRTLFVAYLYQLIISIVVEITVIVFLESHIFYPSNFPSIFFCSIETSSSVNTSFNCSNLLAGSKNVLNRLVTAANGIFAFFAFLEIIWILSRGRHGKQFMENWRFYADHLKSHLGEPELHLRLPDSIPLVESQHRAVKDFQSAIQALKKNCLQETEQLSDLKQPFGRPNPDEGYIHDLTMDEIYVHVAIHEGRALHFFAKDLLGRREQLEEYPPDAEDCQFLKPEDIIDKEHRNVLVVGRPMIGKTSLSTKMLRSWASGESFNGEDDETSAHFDVVFLVKFRRFNDNAELSLRELLARAETVQHLDDAVWDFIKSESAKVLLIFDGVDEYSRKQEMNTKEVYKNNVEEKMPVSVLYNKLAAGKLLRGASILTTTRPAAVKCVLHVRFQRAVEIRGFTSQHVDEYVEKFTRRFPEAKEKMLEHIKSNINLFSLSYIPMMCFLICHCLLQIILSESSQALPTKITDIYKMTVKMIFFNHNREGFFPEELERLKSTHMYEPFENFPEELQKIFNSLGEIAFKGIEEGRLLFESSEVSGLEDCGLLHKLPALKLKALSEPPAKSRFCFTHLTLQEFFAAKHLVNTKTDEGIEGFVRKHINDGTWHVVLQFVAGLLKSSTDIFITLLPKSTEKITNDERSSKPETLTSWPATEKDKLLAVQVCKCLYEINDEQQTVLQNKIEKINFNAVSFSGCLLPPTDLAAVLHFLENAEEVLYIDLSFSEFGDLGANEVKKFIVNRERKLKWLNLRSNKFTDKAAKDLAAALMHSNCKLEYLDLRVINFSKKGRQYLTDAAEHSNCKVLFW